MARKPKDEVKFNYNEQVRLVKENGPERLYFIWGPEDYLSETFAAAIKNVCLPEGGDDFSYRKIGEREFSPQLLQEAIDSVPFLSERTFVEIRGLDLNKLDESTAEKTVKILKDIPDYCTVVILEPSSFEADKRKKIYKNLSPLWREHYISAQQGDKLVNWIVRRFDAAGKRVEINAVQRLISVSGDLMNRLIPEISKVAGYAKGDVVTVEDVEAVAHHIPEAVVFDMTDSIADKNCGRALNLLDELLADKDNEPIALAAMIGYQMRRLYGAKCAIDNGKGKDYISKLYGIRYDFLTNKLMASARKFSSEQLSKAVRICAETDYKLKSSGEDETELLKECVMRIAAGDKYV